MKGCLHFHGLGTTMMHLFHALRYVVMQQGRIRIFTLIDCINFCDFYIAFRTFKGLVNTDKIIDISSTRLYV